MLAIVCSLFLAGTPVVPAPAQAADVGRVAHVSCRCRKACCAAPSSPRSHSVPAAPVPASSHNQFLAFAHAALAWALPAAPAPGFSSSIALLLTANTAPLYARNCARLI